MSVIKQTSKLSRKRNGLLPYMLMLPAMVLFTAFVFFPFLKTIYLTFFLTDIAGQPTKFMGFANYIRVLSNKGFQQSVGISLKFAAMIGFPAFLAGFILALIANEKSRFSRAYEIMFSLPMAIASVPAAAIWMTMMSPTSGILNHLLGTNIRWLTSADTALISVSIITVWLKIGVNFLYLLTGLRNVPVELVESAKIDGAGYFRRLFHVLIPMASPQIFFVVFLGIVSSFQAFGQIRILTGGGPNNATNILIYQIYRSALVNSRYETACVMSLVLFLIIFLITRIQFLLEKRLVNY